MFVKDKIFGLQNSNITVELTVVSCSIIVLCLVDMIVMIVVIVNILAM